jgi:regulator of protease activity HflC (stomatin/prohibitin superfamily)
MGPLRLSGGGQTNQPPPPAAPTSSGGQPPGGAPPPPTHPPGETPWDNVIKNIRWFLFLALVTIVTYFVIYIVVYYLGAAYPSYKTLFNSMMFWGIIAHIVFTMRRKIRPEERGAGFFLGSGLMELESGWAPIPYGIAQLYTITQKPIRIIVGTVTTDRENKPAEVMYDSAGHATVRDPTPRRIKFADGKAAPGSFPRDMDPFPDHPLPEIDDNTRKRLLQDPANTVGTTTEPRVIIEMLIVRVIPFVKKVGDLVELGSKVSEATMAVFQEAAGRIPVGYALENQIVIEGRITYAIEELVGERPFIIRPRQVPKPTVDWGIDFRMAQIQDIGYTHEVNKKIAEATGLAQEGRGLASKSEGEAVAIDRKGAAEAKVLEAKTRAEGKGLEEAAKVIDDYGDSGQAAVELDARVRMMQAGNTNVVIGGGNPLTDAAGVLGTMFGGGQRTTPGNPQPPQGPPKWRGNPGKRGKRGQGQQTPPTTPPAQNP